MQQVDALDYGVAYGIIASNSYIADSLLDSVQQRSSLTSLVRTGFSPASLPETPHAASGDQGFSSSDWVASTGSAISHIPVLNAIVPASDYVRERGRKAYELKNHLGNVLSVVSDLKIGKNKRNSCGHG